MSREKLLSARLGMTKIRQYRYYTLRQAVAVYNGVVTPLFQNLANMIPLCPGNVPKMNRWFIES